jgi:hypothetical protein
MRTCTGHTGSRSYYEDSESITLGTLIAITDVHGETHTLDEGLFIEYTTYTVQEAGSYCGAWEDSYPAEEETDENFHNVICFDNSTGIEIVLSDDFEQALINDYLLGEA